MKKLLLLSATMLSLGAAAQNVGIGTTVPNASALLDVSSTNKGILIPRMTSTQRTSIATPAPGLMVYDSTTNNLWIYNGASWLSVAGTANTWSTSGNSGTNPATHYIGTNDLVSLRFKVDSKNAGFIGINDNLFLGIESGNTDPTGLYNTGFGHRSLYLNTTGNYNTAIGYRPMSSNTTGLQNTAIGAWALAANTTGNYNTAIGTDALNQNTTGNSNVAIGHVALRLNTDRSGLVAIGDSALSFNGFGATQPWEGINNVAIGTKSLFGNSIGSYNTATGNSSLVWNQTGNYNTANGFEALRSNSSGGWNTAQGLQALYSNTTGDYNTAIAVDALRTNSTGDENTANGYRALYSNTTGSWNTAHGFYALNSNTSGNYNSAIGYNSHAGQTVNNATSIGANAFTSCSNCLVLGSVNGVNGASSNVNVGIGTSNPQTALHIASGGTLRIYNATNTRYVQLYHSDPTGNLHLDAIGGGTNYISWLGGSGLHVGNGTSSGYGPVNASAFVVSSSLHVKKDISDMRYGLSQILQLQGKQYKYTNDNTNRNEIGLIAEEVEKILPEVVYRNLPDNNISGIDYGKLVPVLVEAIKEQQQQIGDLKKLVHQLLNK